MVARIVKDKVRGQVIAEAVKDIYVDSSTGRTVVVIGASNLAIIDSPNGLLVISLDEAERLSDIVKRLSLNGER